MYRLYQQRQGRNAMRFVRPAALATLIVLTWALFPTRGAAQEEKAPVVVLLHPSLKAWAKPVEEAFPKLSFTSIKPSERGLAAVTLEIGTSPRVKNWRYAVQIGPVTPPPPVRNLFDGPKPVEIPVVVSYRKSAKETPHVLAKGLMISNLYLRYEPRAWEAVGERFAKDMISSPGLDSNISRLLALQIGDGKPQKSPDGTLACPIPVEIVKGKDGPEAVLKIHNRLPSPVIVRVNSLFGSQFGQPATLSFRVRDMRGDWVDRTPVIDLKVDEKYQVKITDLKGMNVSTVNSTVTIIDPAVAAK